MKRTFSCTNQSWVWNWIHAAASRFSVVAGMNSFRVINISESIRGFGVMISASVGLGVYCLGKFLPNRIPVHPIFGIAVELYVPSKLRASLNRSSSHWYARTKHSILSTRASTMSSNTTPHLPVSTSMKVTTTPSNLTCCRRCWMMQMGRQLLSAVWRGPSFDVERRARQQVLLVCLLTFDS